MHMMDMPIENDHFYKEQVTNNSIKHTCYMIIKK